MHDGMQYDHFQRGLANNHGFLNLGTIPKGYRGQIFLFLSQFLCHFLKLAVSSRPQNVSSISMKFGM